MFDPFTATEQDAKNQPNADGVPDGAFWKWQAAQKITRHKDQYEANPIHGIADCLRAKITPPDWLTSAFLKQFDRVKDAEVRTWDEAFGAPYPKSVHLETIRKSRGNGLLRFMVQNGLLEQMFEGPKRQLKGAGMPRTNKAFKDAAKLVGLQSKNIKEMLAKTRINVRGGKNRQRLGAELAAGSGVTYNNPFSHLVKCS